LIDSNNCRSFLTISLVLLNPMNWQNNWTLYNCLNTYLVVRRCVSRNQNWYIFKIGTSLKHMLQLVILKNDFEWIFWSSMFFESKIEGISTLIVIFRFVPFDRFTFCPFPMRLANKHTNKQTNKQTKKHTTCKQWKEDD
jgi:hypothetical protein